MTPAEEQVAITALLVRGREKLIDYVGEGEMEGVGVGRPQSPARSLARSTLTAAFYSYCVHDWDGPASLSTWEYHGGTRIVDARGAVLSWYCANPSAVFPTSCVRRVSGVWPGSSRQGRRMSDPDIRDIPSRSQHRFVKTWYPPTVPLYVRTGRSGSVSLVPDPDAHPLSEGMSPPGSGQVSHVAWWTVLLLGFVL